MYIVLVVSKACHTPHPHSVYVGEVRWNMRFHSPSLLIMVHVLHLCVCVCTCVEGRGGRRRHCPNAEDCEGENMCVQQPRGQPLFHVTASHNCTVHNTTCVACLQTHILMVMGYYRHTQQTCTAGECSRHTQMEREGINSNTQNTHTLKILSGCDSSH